MVSDMKPLSMRDLNRNTAAVLDALEHGEMFEVQRNGRAVAYLTPVQAPGKQLRNWDAHFAWLRQQKRLGGGFIKELELDRRRLRARERNLDGVE